MTTRRRFTTLMAALAFLAGTGFLPALAEDPILSLSGPSPKGKVALALGLADLDALPQTKFRTTTPWYEGAVEFSGVSLKDALAAAGITGTKANLLALNDYAAEADVAELVAADALLATRQNGKTMPVEDKGPIFLIFPFDSRSELQHQSYYSRAVWQLAEINIE